MPLRFSFRSRQQVHRRISMSELRRRLDPAMTIVGRLVITPVC